MCRPAVLFNGEEIQSMFVDHFQASTTPTGYTGERVFGKNHRQAGLFHNQTIQITQQRATAGENDAAFRNVRTKFWRGLFQSIFTELTIP